jgi:Bacterial PH domain
VSEHDREPIRGLPQALPPGELLLWQGAPDALSLARRGFHVGLLVPYFLLLAVWRFAAVRADGEQLRWATISALWILLIGVAAIATLALIAWLTSRTTVYSITSRRLVVRFGITLPISVNIPFGLVAAAGLRVYRDGSGEIPLSLVPDGRISFPIFWPHARPWRLRRAEPMLRCVPNATQVAEILARALKAAAAGCEPLGEGVASPAVDECEPQQVAA